MLLTLDDADVPMDNRVMVVPPICANDMLGINRFTEQQFIGSGDAIRTGKIGQIYGVDVYISSNCPSAAGNSGADRVGTLMHKDALVLAEQVGVRSQTQYKQEYLVTCSLQILFMELQNFVMTLVLRLLYRVHSS
jgi:hypothetical protein